MIYKFIVLVAVAVLNRKVPFLRSDIHRQPSHNECLAAVERRIIEES
jgi:hypothetical protein